MFSLLRSPSSIEHGFGFRSQFDGSWLPVGREQDTQVVLVGHGGETFEDVGEIGFGVVTLAAGAFDEGVDDGAALAGGLTTHEEPVLFADGGGADSVFDPVVVDLKAAVFNVGAQPVPDGEGVVDGAAELALGQDLRVLAQGDELGFEDLQEGRGAFAADERPLRGVGAGLAQPGLDLIELLESVSMGGAMC